MRGLGIFLAFLTLVGLGAAGWRGYHVLNTWAPLQSDQPLEVEIPGGLTPWHLAPYLAKTYPEIQFPWLPAFRWQARHHYRNKTLQAGVYQLNPGENFGIWLQKFEKGRPRLYPLLIFEGMTVADIGNRLVKEGILGSESVFKDLAQSPEFLTSQGISLASVEGYLFPSTYYVPKPYTAEALLRKMIAMYWKQTRSQSFEIRHSYLNSHEAYLILASIIEKETGLPQERRIISGVFHNRLKQGMRLESDPTVIYGIQNFDGNLKRIHLETWAPYNTYRIEGLPPGPICNPGLEALQAAYIPEEHAYLYFVSRNDGSHVFSSTYEEHLTQVKRFQKRKANPQQTLPLSP
jgi:UPF0755 protein